MGDNQNGGQILAGFADPLVWLVDPWFERCLELQPFQKILPSRFFSLRSMLPD